MCLAPLCGADRVSFRVVLDDSPGFMSCEGLVSIMLYGGGGVSAI